MANINATEVRSRCQWESTEVTDTLLDSAAFIPAGDAWLNKKLSNAGKSAFGALDTDDQALAKAAEIAMVAAVVATRASQGSLKTGLLSVKDNSQQELIKLAQELRDEVKTYLGLLGVLEDGGFYFDSKGGSAYSPDGDDETNVDFAQADYDTPLSLWM